MTTGAYLDFIGRGGLREQVLSAARAVGGPGTSALSDFSTLSGVTAAATRIAELFAGQSLPTETADTIARAYAALGAGVPVAVRSSATSEDQPGMSAAGQHDTYLNVCGEAAVLDAVKRCWASLWSERAIAYRASRGIDPGEVSIAVVVQRLVPAAAAGVMFTADYLGGTHAADSDSAGGDNASADGGRIVINANWGLGESVVAGEVTPDLAVVNRETGTLASYQTGSKETMTVADTAATTPAAMRTTSQDTPSDLRAKNVLSPDQAAELARVGLEIEKLCGEPVDVEWALAAGKFFVLQARPITASVTAPALPGQVTPGTSTPADHEREHEAERWNDTLAGDYLWSNGNLGEALPDVMTPATWSFIELLMTRMTFPPHLPGYKGYGRIGGRFYINVSMSIALEAMAGISARRFAPLLSPVVGKLPPVEEIPRPRLPRGKAIRMMIPELAATLCRLRAARKRMSRFLEESPDRCDRLGARIERETDPSALASLWTGEVRPLLLQAFDTLAAATSSGTTVLTAPGRLAKLVGEEDATLLMSVQEGGEAGGTGLASLGPVIGVARLARGEIDRGSFVREYGHRSAGEVELSVPRPAEDPAWLDAQLAAFSAAPSGAASSAGSGTARDAVALLAAREAARRAAWERLERGDPKKAGKAHKLVGRWAPIARDREAARSEVARAAWVARTWVRRAGQLTGHRDDLFFLEVEETCRLLRGDQAPLTRTPARKTAYETYRALPPFPTLIRGGFDPVRWARDSHRRADYYDEHARHPKNDEHAQNPERAGQAARAEAITGFPGAAGTAEGPARVLTAPDEAARLGDGDILVTTVTNIGWTPLFPRAAAVVTDVGAPLSHAAIVARELGIPAVVGCGNATTLIRDGDRIRVDGSRGTVKILDHAG